MAPVIEWKQLPRGTYRYIHNGMIADVWQVAGYGWLWSVSTGNHALDVVAAHEGLYQLTLDGACEIALKAMAV